MSETSLIDRVDRDPELGGDEKETTISMLGQADRFTIYSAKPTIVKSLLQHNHFDLDWTRIIRQNQSVQLEDRNHLKDSEGSIVAVKGTMPIGVLNIKYKPRTNNNQSSIITTETVDPSVFEDS